MLSRHRAEGQGLVQTDLAQVLALPLLAVWPGAKCLTSLSLQCSHPFIPDILTERSLWARPGLGPGGTAMNKLTSGAYSLEGETEKEQTEKVSYILLDSTDS